MNSVTENGSALHEAVFYGRVDIVRILLDYRIDTSLVNKQGKNVFDLLEQLNTGVSRTIESIIESKCMIILINGKSRHLILIFFVLSYLHQTMP